MKQQAYNVYLFCPEYEYEKLLDTVFYEKGTATPEVKRDLVNHDGYPSNIRVVKA